MWGDPFHIENFEAVPGKKRFQGNQTVVTVMFVINNIILIFLKEVDKVVDFKNKDSSGAKQAIDASHYLIQIINMCHNIVGKNGISLSVFVGNFLSQGHIKIANDSFQFPIIGDFGDISSRINAYRIDAKILQRFEKHSVVAANVDNERVLDQKSFNHFFRIILEMSA